MMERQETGAPARAASGVRPEDRERILSLARKRCQEYRQTGFHCSESVLRACSEIIGLRLSDDVLRTACGFRGGGGGYRDRCGILEAGCMLVSYLYGRSTPYEPSWTYSYLIRVLHERFKAHFDTIYCRDIRAREEAAGADPICFLPYQDGAGIVAGLLLDAPALLEAAPPEER